jgi:hypothetical protein
MPLEERVPRGVEESDETTDGDAETEEHADSERAAESDANAAEPEGDVEAWPLVDAEVVNSAVCDGAMAEPDADSLPPMPLLVPKGDCDAESEIVRSMVRVTACESVGVADELTEPERDGAAVDESRVEGEVRSAVADVVSDSTVVPLLPVVLDATGDPVDDSKAVVVAEVVRETDALEQGHELALSVSIG